MSTLLHTGERAHDIVITVSLLQEDIMDNGNNRCGEIIGEADPYDSVVNCDQLIKGQYVQLQKSNSSTHFHLAEVEVFGVVF